MTKPTEDDPKGISRRPAAFSLEQEASREGAHTKTTAETPRRKPQSFDTEIVLTPDEEDPFLNPALTASDAEAAIAAPRRRRFSFGKVALSAFGILVSLAFGLWTDELIRNLFSRADWLGYTALTVLAIGILAVLAIVVRETAGMMRLAAVQTIKAEADAAVVETRPARAKALVQRLCTLLEANPATAKGRATLKAAEDDIIDAPHLIDLAERELLGPLDRSARVLILGASKRVSVVTAVSPRALVDILYVLYEFSQIGPRHGGALWRQARRARHAQADARCARPPRRNRLHRRWRQHRTAVDRPWPGLETLGSTGRRRRQRHDDSTHRHRRHGSLPTPVLQGIEAARDR